MSANLFVAGRIIWRAELKETKSGSSMRGVLVGLDDGGEAPRPPCFVTIFGDDAETGSRRVRLLSNSAAIDNHRKSPRIRITNR